MKLPSYKYTKIMNHHNVLVRFLTKINLNNIKDLDWLIKYVLPTLNLMN